jgi:hypothetical protein
MHITYRHEIVKQTHPDYALTRMPFYSANGEREGAVAGRVHRILGLISLCFDRWLKPLFFRAERNIPSPIQERDPYVEALLRYLQGKRRD